MLLMFTAGALVGGCSNDTPKVDGSTSAVGVTTEAVAAVPGDTSGQPAAAGTFNPFGDQNAPPQGPRVIIAQPTRDDIFAPSPIPEMALGKPDAPVTMVQYASMTCPHCRAFHRDTFPEFKKSYIDTGKVRYVLREFPIGKQSGNATIALRCAPADKYFTLYGKLMEQQDSWVSQEVRLEPIFKVAKQVGLTQAQFDACLKDEKLVAGLNAVKDRGRTLGIIGTPNFFVGTTLVKKQLTMADIRALVDPMLAGTAPIAQRN